jgi:hypothetical protein
MPSTIETLRAINTTEPRDFESFLDGLPDRPRRGERSAWAELFDTIGALESMELIVVVRDGHTNRIDSIQLTTLGAERVRESTEEAYVRPKPTATREPNRTREPGRRPFN